MLPAGILPIIIISFIATIVRSTFGFGESLVAVPMLVLVVPLGVAVPLSVLISLLVAMIVVAQDHKVVHIASAKWLILYALPGIPIGLLILRYGNDYWMKIGLGLLIIGYSIYTMTAKNTLHLKHDNRFWLFICGFLSGIFGGAYGLNGPPLVIYANMRKWTAQHFRATLQAYFLPASFIGIIGYIVQGLIRWVVIEYFLFCLPAIIPAIFLGRYFNKKLNGPSFFHYVYWGLIFVGSVLVVCTATGV